MGIFNDFTRVYKKLSETTLHLMKKVPGGSEDFKPSAGEFMTLGQLLHHLGETQRLFNMIFEGTLRELDRNFMEYMGSPPSSLRDEAIRSYEEEYSHALGRLEKMTDDEFAKAIFYFWTVDDEPLPFITYNIIEHHASHKYQLFTYLKLMGLPGMDSFALGGEDTLPREKVIEMYMKAHEDYDRKHGVRR